MPQPLDPVELESEFIAAQFGAVGDINIDDADALYRRRDQSRRGLLVIIGKIVLDTVNIAAGKDRHAVVAFLAEDHRLIADLSKIQERKLVVRAFYFLQAKDVRLILVDPAQYGFQTDIDGIDVPGGDLHGNYYRIFALGWLI